MKIKPFLTTEEIVSLQQIEASSDKLQKRTPEQIEAIYSHGKNILVSASAGSGKTFVMIERIFDIISRGYRIDQLFISTFTVKAAGELKERLEKKLSQALTETEDVETRQHLSTQIQQLALADIGTMDAFTNKLVSRYAYLLGLSPRFRILQEQSDRRLLQDEVFSELFPSYLEGKSSRDFVRLVSNFSGNRKDSKAFQEVVYAIYEFSQSMPNPKDWIKDILLSGHSKFLNLDHLPESWVEQLLATLEQTADAVENLTQLPDYPQLTKANKPTAKYKNHLQQIQTLRETREQLLNGDKSSFSQLLAHLTQVLPTGEEVTVNKVAYPIYTAIQFHLARFRHLETILNYQGQASPLLAILRDFVDDFSQQFLQLKIQENALEFSDISHFAIELLENHEQLRQQFQDGYVEVMVDEYQDNNHLQERLLDLLSNGRNRFMVGDIKQSIYRFRQSDPQIFKAQFDRYQKQSDQGQLILLKENFRSQSSVLDTTNAFFRRLMDESIGDVRYDQSHQLLVGSPAQEVTDKQFQTQFYLYDLDQKDEQSEVGELDLIAREIIKLYHQGVAFSNICLLVPSRTANDQLLKTLGQYGIPVVVDEQAKNYLQSIEVMVMLDTLRTINNPLNDYPLVALLRSPMFAFNEDDLARIALQSKENIPFYKKLQLAIAHEGEAPDLIDVDLEQRLKKFHDCLDKWRQAAKVKSLYHLIWQIYEEKFYYDYVGALPKGQQAQANLYALASRAHLFEQTGFKGLTRFIQMIDKVLANQHDLANVELPVNQNAVNLMTIHKSKGLEFDYVFVLNLAKAFNKHSSRQAFTLSRDLGLGIQYVADMKAEFDTNLASLPVSLDTLAYQVIKEQNDLADLSERLRLLYVAMTRAKKKLYLIGQASQEKFTSREASPKTAEGYLAVNVRQSASSFQDLLLATLATFPQKDFALNLDFVGPGDLTPDKIGQLDDCPLAIDEILNENSQAQFAQALRDLEAALTYNKKFEAAIALPSVRTPSQLKSLYQPVTELEGVAILDKEDVRLDFSLPDFKSSKPLSPVALGSATHQLMQLLPLSEQVDLSQLKTTLAQLDVDKNVKRHIDLGKLAAFFQTDLGLLLQKHHHLVQREAPFSMLHQDEASGEDYIIRGILDGYLVLDDRIILFDYKTDRFSDKQVLVNRYRNQMTLYAKALSQSYQIETVEKYLILLGGKQLEVVKVP
ncbi:helicase-exonuclease AddAB subunit AddA [Streptococcus sp. sy010]|uniref:helicase-exonuclease AddAB subunit AddA n=1 Tax=Streptococcus sp. sy010 TaxID=2600148 RepID=UPI0011B77075|nr:helicase-exonuclease AddAB subunit AddA [Streptococcus sp. sy010]TWT16469.1 helicase-exonuclease AddAB subunit AddA [Streptococcus sp. sy010]